MVQIYTMFFRSVFFIAVHNVNIPEKRHICVLYIIHRHTIDNLSSCEEKYSVIFLLEK